MGPAELSRRLAKLEESFGASEDPGQEAMDRAIQQAPLEVITPLYEAVNRVYGPPPSSSGPDRIDLAELWPELTPVEAEAVEKLMRIAESPL
jgi:hypothetical protein